MPDNSNNPINFWQELKRRKVIRVITVYAAAAFVIIELVSNTWEPFGLPDWTLKFVFVILCIGLIISIILSWIYDVTPEGLEKTKAANEVKEEVSEKPSRINAWKIATGISVVIIVGLIIFHTIGERKQSEDHTQLDKSIAVLPFKNDSPDNENVYIINGTMEAILDNLCKIENLRVVARTSVEQYRDNPKPITEIGREMNVSYILEGSGQKYGNNVRLTFQLIDARNDEHLWSSPYSREIVMEEIFDLQSEIAKLVAAEIDAIITPEEKQLIEKIPTTSLTAYDFYQRGKEEHWKYRSDNDNKEALERAEDLYHEALEYDHTFAVAYTGLARVYWDKHYWETYFTENFLDSVLILADIAISHDNQIEEAYVVRGDCYREIGQTEQANKEYDKAIALNSNSWMAYRGKGDLHWSFDFVKAIENFHKAASLNRGSELPTLLSALWNRYYQAGLREEALYYLREKLKLDGDSVVYYYYLSWDAYYINDFAKGIEFGKKAWGIDSSNFGTQKILGLNYSFLGQYEQSLKYLKKSIERRDTLGALQINYMHRLGYAYWQNGSKEEADYYFDKQIDYCNWANELGRQYSKNFDSYYDLACVYAFRGEKDKAYKNLRIFNQKQTVHFGVSCRIKRDPLFDSIRDEPEFQQIVQDMEAKYQAEHERVFNFKYSWTDLPINLRDTFYF